MKNQELFDKTVSILVKAYQNETLTHTDACGCAVGNLVASSLNFKISDNAWWNGKDMIIPSWQEVFCSCGLKHQDIDLDYYDGDAKREIDSTGYTWQELAKIEKAFESVNVNFDVDGYKGLMKVIDALMLIHEANETEVKEAKELFVKA